MSLRERPATQRTVFGALIGAGFGLFFGVGYAVLRGGPFDLTGRWVADAVNALYGVSPTVGVTGSVGIFTAGCALWGLLGFRVR